MRRRTPVDAIDFPANPFVALSDFTMIVLLLVVLGFVYQSVSSNRLFERLAVTNLQNRLQTELSGNGNKTVNRSAACQQLFRGFAEKTVVGKATDTDGDLQRFRIDGTALYRNTADELHPRYELTTEGRQMLTGFGEVLRNYQGDTAKPGTGLFKRIQIQGNADRSEGDDNTAWLLSLARAREAAQILQNNGGVSPLLIEATGRGCWDPRLLPGQAASGAAETRAAQNRRLEIVVIYSAVRAAQYEQELGKNKK
ncbi:MAG: OmpA family protein [Akkermansiaceae bacterium]|nr:OmpA family protein [Armatimonadota bacterium]